MAIKYWTGNAPLTAQSSYVSFATNDPATTRKITIGGVTLQVSDSYGFTCTSATYTIGAVYTNNGQSFTAVTTASGTLGFYAHGTGSPTSSGTLTKISGTGDATITFSNATIGDLGLSLANLTSILSASANPYFSSILWTSQSTTITGTSKTAGLPFTMTGSVSGGGTGTVGNVGVQVDLNANGSPNDWGNTANWSAASLPVAGDTVIFANNSTNVCWGLTTGIVGAGIAVLRFEQSYTGKVGLNYLGFATSADGATVNTSYPEYRQLYLSATIASLRIGDSSSIGSSSGSPRLMVDLGTTSACTVEIVNTANSSADTNRPAVRLLGVKTTHALNVRLASGGVGIAAEVPGEVSTFGTINISDQTGSSKVVTGRGVTISAWIQDGGSNTLASDQTVPAITCNGGTLTTEGAGATTLLSALGGTVNHNSGTSSNVTGTITLRGGQVTSYGSAVARTWTTINIYKGSTLTLDNSVISNTTLAAQERLTFAT